MDRVIIGRGFDGTTGVGPISLRIFWKFFSVGGLRSDGKCGTGGQQGRGGGWGWGDFAHQHFNRGGNPQMDADGWAGAGRAKQQFSFICVHLQMIP